MLLPLPLIILNYVRPKIRCALVITRGAQGIDGAIVPRLVQEGTEVIFDDVLAIEGEAQAKELGKNTQFVKHDVTIPSELAKIIAEVI